jgi:hypothetical protein
MELSEEQKQRIREEEQQRLAEEEFRAKVRRDLAAAKSDPVSLTPDIPSRPRQTRTAKIVLSAIALVVFFGGIVAIGMLVRSRQRPIGETAGPHPPESGNGSARAQQQSGGTGESQGSEAPHKLTTEQIAEKAIPSVVVIESSGENGAVAKQGSGFVSADSVIVTNYHVIRGAGSLLVRIAANQSFRVDSIIGYDISHDLAAFRVEGLSVPALTMAESEVCKVGDKVIAVGAPRGLESTVSEGIISALRDVSGTRIIQTTTSISPGSSGGPLLDENAQVIGVTTAQNPNGQNLNFVVAARHILDLLAQKREIALVQMLSETRVTESLPANTFVVPARNGMKLPFLVRGEEGAVLEGTYAVRGGTGSDVQVTVVDSQNRTILDSGRVRGFGQIRQQLGRGNYSLMFDNRFSVLSPKSVSADLKLTYYR